MGVTTMRKIHVDSLSPGMKVGRPVFNSRGQVLLNAGVELTKRYIEKLKVMGIPSLYIDDGFLSDVQVDDVITDEARTNIKKKVRDFYTRLESEPSAAQTVIGMKDINNLVNEIIDQLLESKDIVVNIMDIRTLDEYTFGHSVNVCVLALMTGIKLGYSKAKLYHLAMGALLHDVGKTCIPEHILNKPGKLTDEEFNEIKKHPNYGYEILIKNPCVSRLSALIAQQHHERLNGDGYPYNLKDDEIHELAKVTGMVDIYDALTADRVYRRALPPHEAYEMISACGDYYFDFHLVQAFLHNVAAFPSGSLVKLNTGETAGVIETFPGYTKQPKVRILLSSNGQPLKNKREIWLAEDYNVFITSVIDDESELKLIKKKLSLN
jgi:HD-GYP domain-containing protein (c-di-GMP phosphodiesterase class II)